MKQKSQVEKHNGIPRLKILLPTLYSVFLSLFHQQSLLVLFIGRNIFYFYRKWKNRFLCIYLFNAHDNTKTRKHTASILHLKAFSWKTPSTS